MDPVASAAAVAERNERLVAEYETALQDDEAAAFEAARIERLIAKHGAELAYQREQANRSFRHRLKRAVAHLRRDNAAREVNRRTVATLLDPPARGRPPGAQPLRAAAAAATPTLTNLSHTR